ncbi:methyl-accepting chemotaxis protein [Hydrocarboniclastica marina]|uniref:Methyl-accepting chemotaxis protein n=1 Tax=Hydrocarboniclastica marina TaxID=2259620 RepID=A0A4P7XI39_9ALTE|nr:methyl-accepting chemotaxis protein [Hydrocarboniclastica marina]MAL97645.1 chemotaxis protein [Alteromonadaceae bacterium]QCF26731.1 methyl-accepting chemotaxis protein [Hydrocarboniclastica marina]|tara:strand:- start:888 stop:2459 length:1572 start_codon:yes stop_codon:yes gene_type:complete
MFKTLLENLAVAKKLAIGFGILLVLLLTVSTVSLFSLTEYNHRVKIVEQANAAEIALLDAERDQKNFQIEGDERFLNHAVELVDKSVSILGPMALMIAEVGDRQLVEQIVADLKAYKALLRQYGITNASQQDLIASIEEQMGVAANSAIEKAEMLKKREQSLMAERYDLTVAEIISVTAIAISIAVFIAWGLTRSITGPIKESVEIATKVASGDLTLQISSKRRDEFGLLLTAFATMTTNLRALVREIDNGAVSIASASEELSIVTNETSRGVAEQQSQTDQVSTAMNEMVATVSEVAKSAEAAFQAANRASEKSGNGEKAVKETLQFVAELNTQIVNVMKQLSGLQSETNNIGTVLDVIKSVAEQTNLLALNAAIEAARAGEQGRGFAVVADEVRSLAQRTQTSAKEIEALIGTLVDSAESSVASMEVGHKLSEQTLERAELAGTAIQEVSGAVEEIRQHNSQIATAAEQQSSVAEDINHNITQIRDVGNQSAASTEEVSAASAELARLAEGLRTQVARFTV